MEVVFQHMLPLADFAWKLCSHRLEQLMRTPDSTAARVHQWLTAAEGNSLPALSRSHRDFVASCHLLNVPLECHAINDPHPYQDLPGGFLRHFQSALFPPWIIGRGTMT